MKQFKLWNTLCGWLVFAVAAVTYLLTMEPTASFWDCGEFISSAWDNAIHLPSKAGDGLRDVDYETILSCIANTIG